MSKQRHTPEPWTIDKGQLRGPDGDSLGSIPHTLGGEEDEANGKRIVACVNACERINPEAVGYMLAACKQFVSAYEGYVGRDDGDLEDLGDAMLAAQAAAVKATESVHRCSAV